MVLASLAADTTQVTDKASFADHRDTPRTGLEKASTGGIRPPGVGYARPVQQAYNRMQPSVNTAQFARPGYGSSFNGSYGNRPGAYYGNSQPVYRAPAAGFQSHQFAERSSGAYGGKGFNGIFRLSNRTPVGASIYLVADIQKRVSAAAKRLRRWAFRWRRPRVRQTSPLIGSARSGVPAHLIRQLIPVTGIRE